jgi:hypothetical protein
MSDGLYHVDLWVLFVALTVFLTVTMEACYRVGRHAPPRLRNAPSSSFNAMQTSVLGLLALLLGFSFAMAESRYQTRKDLVITESNSIGTTWLRAQLLPEPQRTEIARLLEAYVDARIAFHLAGRDPARLRKPTVESERLQGELWSRGAAAAALDVRAQTTALFLQSLNDTIDLHTRRVTALENRVPVSILGLLVFVAMMSCGLIGYGNGLGGNRNFVVSLVTVLVFCGVMTLTVDLDRPARGLVQVPQNSMLRLRRSIAVPPAGATRTAPTP